MSYDATVMDARDMGLLLSQVIKKVDQVNRHPKLELTYDEAIALAAVLNELADDVKEAGPRGRYSSGRAVFVGDRAFMTVHVVAPGHPKGQ